MNVYVRLPENSMRPRGCCKISGIYLFMIYLRILSVTQAVLCEIKGRLNKQRIIKISWHFPGLIKENQVRIVGLRDLPIIKYGC